MLNYQILDNGHSDKWLVLIHGFGGTNDSWKNQLPDLHAHNTLMIELPFHGKSINYKQNFKIKCLNNAIKMILDKENIQSADFAGISLGTLVIANFTNQYPQYVKRIILVGSVIEISFFVKSIAVIAYTWRNKLPYHQLCKAAVFVVEPSEENKKDRKTILSGFHRMSKEQMINWVEYIGSTVFSKNLISCLKEKKKDILFISGVGDIFFLAGAKQTAEKLSNKAMQVLQGCSHICNTDNPRLFNDTMLSFLA